MPGLTQAQLVTLGNDIEADPLLNSQPNTNDGNAAIATVYGLVATPDFWVWRTRVSKEEYTTSVGPTGTTFQWTTSGYIGRSTGERDAFREIFGPSGVVNPSMSNVRQAFADIFNGNANNITHLTALSRRRANRVEKLLAAGTGSAASPATMGYEGLLSYDDVAAARAT